MNKIGTKIATVWMIGQDVPDEIAFPLMLERFKFLTVIDPATGCWNWTGRPGHNGYAQASFRGKRIRINRLMYMVAKGPIPDGQVVMHSCDNRQCVNPEHLSVGAQRDNLLDCLNKGRNFHSNKTHCPRGHAYDAENQRIELRVTNGRYRRVCKPCQRISIRKRVGWPEHLWGLPAQPLGQKPPELIAWQSSQSQNEVAK